MPWDFGFAGGAGLTTDPAFFESCDFRTVGLSTTFMSLEASTPSADVSGTFVVLGTGATLAGFGCDGADDEAGDEDEAEPKEYLALHPSATIDALRWAALSSSVCSSSTTVRFLFSLFCSRGVGVTISSSATESDEKTAPRAVAPDEAGTRTLIFRDRDGVDRSECGKVSCGTSENWDEAATRTRFVGVGEGGSERSVGAGEGDRSHCSAWFSTGEENGIPLYEVTLGDEMCDVGDDMRIGDGDFASSPKGGEANGDDDRVTSGVGDRSVSSCRDSTSCVSSSYVSSWAAFSEESEKYLLEVPVFVVGCDSLRDGGLRLPPSCDRDLGPDEKLPTRPTAGAPRSECVLLMEEKPNSSSVPLAPAPDGTGTFPLPMGMWPSKSGHWSSINFRVSG